MNNQTKIKEYLENARRQRKWAAMTFRDMKYSQTQAKKLRKIGASISAWDFEREVRACKLWYNKRMKLAKHYENHAKKLGVKK
jgi:hypothetical protein